LKKVRNLQRLKTVRRILRCSNRWNSSAAKYRKVSPIEHVLLRSDSYVGSNSLTDEQVSFLYDSRDQKIRRESIRYVPALLKIFDEILVNAADNKQRDSNMKHLSVNVDRQV
uniref:DNA topoisomerase (ATP-hydrolyzing) n=1 Tax=Enterobius vermicularis TaxID=51028 RepID=A0A0N4VCX0_ENTVE